MIDLRSDTVTKPVPEMREAIKQAEVGDDVYGEDPTVNELQRKAAEKFGKEASLFVPSGSMGNQVSINVSTQPGQEVILDSECHIYNHEMGAMSSISGVLPRSIETEKNYLPIDKVRENIWPGEYYFTKTGLIALENTQNQKGGVIYPEDKKDKLIDLADERDIPVHLDGARIFNASIATNTPVNKLTEGFTSVMFCLSKGLGAPVGSMVVGSHDFIEEARRVRKTFGGGMRQVGVLAAAGLYALENHIERLGEDHENAKILADFLEDLNQIKVNDPETNIIMIELKDDDLSAERLVEELEKKNILTGTIGSQKIRMVTHLGINREDVEKTAEVIKSII
ncbi:threonine aldolase [candidate division MSBL1 archaeon SCGC-AAA259D14]|uniref:Threonine aldolase n=2 Tax=candidate division MSBL1 TaxID=215777 RepID=A0A133U969_9EURY|nr:threonine aldolase [candidate division MSBL1 archaeon SCGC-AAA259D14]KXA98837.1 threonine aldolase [candidate division MSBL1 archaeon SCGC-AAA259J03]